VVVVVVVAVVEVVPEVGVGRDSKWLQSARMVGTQSVEERLIASTLTK